MAESSGGAGIVRVIIVLAIVGVGGYFIWSKHEAGAPARANNEAVVQLDAGNPAQALSILEEALRRHSGHAMLHYNRGVALQDLNRHEEAIEAFQRAMSLDPAITDSAEEAIADSREALLPEPMP